MGRSLTVGLGRGYRNRLCSKLGRLSWSPLLSKVLIVFDGPPDRQKDSHQKRTEATEELWMYSLGSPNALTSTDTEGEGEWALSLPLPPPRFLLIGEVDW